MKIQTQRFWPTVPDECVAVDIEIPDELLKLLQRCDVMIFIRKHETQPNVLLDIRGGHFKTR